MKSSFLAFIQEFIANWIKKGNTISISVFSCTLRSKNSAFFKIENRAYCIY